MVDDYLCISDLQSPYHARRAIQFLKRVQKEFKIPRTNILCGGDENDSYHFSKYPKNPDQKDSTVEEFEKMKDFMRELAEAFPIMRLCYSNHGARPLKRLLEAGIPSIFMRDYKQLISAPNSWQWQRSWMIKTKSPFMIEHGHKWKGTSPQKTAAINNGVSTVIGHHHSKAGIDYVTTEHRGTIWGFNIGCLIDREAIAFEYDTDNSFQPSLGCGVITDNGRRPIWVPYFE